MKFYIFILLSTCCITIVTSISDCKWTKCRGQANHNGVCAEFGKTNGGYSYYNGNVDLDDCKWFDSKRLCCRQNISRSGCKWTTKCWGVNVDTACRSEFGDGYVSTYTRNTCRGLESAKYECCPK